MKRLSITFICFLFIINVSGEPLTIKGNVYDSNTGKPISFANIAIIELHKGTTSLENGDFFLTIDSSDIVCNLVISCLNYNNKSIALKNLDMHDKNNIVLEPIIYNIPEVIIKPKKQVEKVINKLIKSEINGGLTCENIPKIYARYFTYNENYSTISSIQIYCQSWEQKDASKVRIRLFRVDSISKQPSSDILHFELITKLQKGKINNIELLDYNIKVPKEGIFVGIEWLIIPENIYEHIYENAKGKTQRKFEYGPILGANYREESNTWLFWAGKWVKEIISVPPLLKIKKELVYDAGISITLTN